MEEYEIKIMIEKLRMELKKEKKEKEENNEYVG